ncbi:MAG: penicillin-binding transpeptidase domain-containing protein [Sandaracinaceae bacterium]|nr:penicillin-binding transpeptidase domain-containing protein [Sandaracinaceae bacterium]
MHLLPQRRDVAEFRKRYKWMALFVCLIFMVLYGRAIQLQILDHDRYLKVSYENITRYVPIPPTRGIIRDTKGQILATNRPSYDVYIIPSRLGPKDPELIATLMGLTPEEKRRFFNALNSIPARRRSHQIRFFSDISREQLAALQTHVNDLTHRQGRREVSAIEIVVNPVRTYPFRSLGAHIIGYLNEIQSDELPSLRNAGYRLGDRIGRTGIEQAWEHVLRGRRGHRKYLVDADLSRSEKSQAIEVEEAIPGRDITLSIDMDLMRIIERAMRGHPSGAAAVVDVNTGAVRALFSKPSYDPEIMSTGISIEEYAALREDPFRPLIDKTLYEAFFPGSVFKPFSAMAALEEKLMDRSERVRCHGSYRFGGRDFPCNVRGGAW